MYVIICYHVNFHGTVLYSSCAWEFPSLCETQMISTLATSSLPTPHVLNSFASPSNYFRVGKGAHTHHPLETLSSVVSVLNMSVTRHNVATVCSMQCTCSTIFFSLNFADLQLLVLECGQVSAYKYSKLGCSP